MKVNTNISRKLQSLVTYSRCIAVLISCIFCVTSAKAEASNFFNERYRGWLWFEEDRKESVRQSQKDEGSDQESNQERITPEIAKEEIERFAKELDDAKYVMLARPTPQNIKAYMEVEAIAWRNIASLQKAWEQADFLYPEHRDLINEPVNVHAVKLRREMDEINQAGLIKDFAKEFDLVLFFKGNCKFCHAFEPVLKNFGGSFGFKVEAITMDGTKSKNFVTANLPALAKKLGIEAAPTLVAVSKDGKVAFELSKGFLSLTELEQHSARAAEYLVSKSILQRSPDIDDEKSKARRKIVKSNILESVDLLTQDKIKKLKR